MENQIIAENEKFIVSLNKQYGAAGLIIAAPCIIFKSDERSQLVSNCRVFMPTVQYQAQDLADANKFLQSINLEDLIKTYTAKWRPENEKGYAEAMNNLEREADYNTKNDI